MDETLSAGQVEALIHAFLGLDTDEANEDEVFRRTVSLFNHIYVMGQQHERARYHERHRDDPDEWEETAEIVQPQLSYVRRARR